MKTLILHPFIEPQQVVDILDRWISATVTTYSCLDYFLSNTFHLTFSQQFIAFVIFIHTNYIYLQIAYYLQIHAYYFCHELVFALSAAIAFCCLALADFAIFSALLCIRYKLTRNRK